MSLRENAKLLTVAVVCLAAGVATPALAATVVDFARNADKVDGKHAVGAGASVDTRKGRLVATSRTTGRLPNNIIAKAADADRLDGLDASAFAPAGAGRRLASGETAVGVFRAVDPNSLDFADEWGKTGTTTVTWPAVSGVSEPPVPHYVPLEGPSVEACPGTVDAPMAWPGHVCFYAAFGPHTDAGHVSFLDPTQAAVTGTASRYGVVLTVQNKDNTNALEAYGTWAVTAP